MAMTLDLYFSYNYHLEISYFFSNIITKVLQVTVYPILYKSIKSKQLCLTYDSSALHPFLMKAMGAEWLFEI
jgi:hypothetical protein